MVQCVLQGPIAQRLEQSAHNQICAVSLVFSLLPEGSVTEAKVTKAQPYLEEKPKGDNSMVVKVR
jgi:hypothetical protein